MSGRDLGVLGGIFLFGALISIVCYILNSVGLSKMAKKLNVENPWMAWIPLLNILLIGKIAGGSVKAFGKEVGNLGVVLLVGSFVVGVLTFIPLLNFLIVIAYLVLFYSTLNKIYKIFNEDSATMFTVLSFLFVGLQPILLFIASNKEPNLAIFNEGGTYHSEIKVDEYEYEYEEDDEDTLI